MIKAAREQNRLLWLRVLQRIRERPGPRPRVVLFGESLGAHTSQDVFLHWGTLGLDALGIDRALWIGTPYGSKWMPQVTERGPPGRRPDGGRRRQRPRPAGGPGRNAGRRCGTCCSTTTTTASPSSASDLLWTPPALAGPRRPRPEPVAAGSPRGIPPGMRWRPITTFFQSLVDMKNAQIPGPYRAWAHDYRADLPRFVSAVYGLPATPEQLARIETRPAAARERPRAALRRRLTGDSPDPPAGTVRCTMGGGRCRSCARGIRRTWGPARWPRSSTGRSSDSRSIVALAGHPPTAATMIVSLVGVGRRGRAGRDLQRGRRRRDQ